MLELADIVRAVKPEERARLAVLASQQRALQAIEQCRTAALGGQMRDALKARGWLGALPPRFWAKPWVVHSQPAGRGEKVLQYLGRYVFRIAISNSRLERFENGELTFGYRDNRTHQIKRVSLSTHQFLARFLQHVLPAGFAKVRHYGLGASACQKRHDQARALLEKLPTKAAAQASPSPEPLPATQPTPPMRCPACGTGQLILRGEIRPQRRIPP